MRVFVVVAALLGFVASSNAADPQKPVWPPEFSSPFGLYMDSPLTKNATSYFYYEWTKTQSTLIDYVQTCINSIPHVTAGHPCRLYFNPNGTYLSAPAVKKPCCLLFAGVGSVPPAFLAGFNYDGTKDAIDFAGTSHHCNYWSAPDFAYWTDINTGFDVYFGALAASTYWAWGEFDVSEQDPDSFKLPGSEDECNQPCVSSNNEQDQFSLSSDVLSDPYVRLAIAYSKQQNSDAVAKVNDDDVVQEQ